MSKKISKTKKMLIEVARDLFARYGKRNITMNDIAEASNKGRRTLYTYFNNKEKIFRAVIDKELEFVIDQLTKAANEAVEPDIKLRNHINTHLDAVKYVVNRNGSLKADFFRDIYEVERARRKIDQVEISLIRNILEEGIEKKIFKRVDTNLSSIIIFYAIKGLEVPYIRQTLTSEFERNKSNIVDFIFTGIVRKGKIHD
ncbi:MAG: TetR/AcrR family transcriptional regulator [Paludibacter sp.]|nr:TetR/AcrR family transcriptional regulator [Paludibacter sp.]